MPLLGTRGAASARGFGFSGLLPQVFWIATLGGASNDYGYGIAVDGSGNSYVVAISPVGASNDMLVTKYNKSGIIQWQRTLGGPGNTDESYGIAVDSSGNCYTAGWTNTSGAGSTDVLITKYNTSGAIQWQRTFGGGSSDFGYGIAIDSSGNCYVTGYTNSAGAGSSDLLITKYNTSGTYQWQRVLGSVDSEQGRGIAVDSSGNCYVTGYTNGAGGGILYLLIAKYNTSGAIQWQRILGSTNATFGYGIAVDSSGNCYVTGSTNSTGAGGYDVLIAKYNTSGTIQWQRVLGSVNSDQGQGIAVDSSGNCYVAGYTDGAGVGSYDVLIAKYNTSGTIQWQRVLGGTASDEGYGIAVDSSGNCYVAGYTNSTGAGGRDVLIAKLPGDGSKTGTYGPWTYQASSLTAATSTLTDSASSLTDATPSMTSATSTLTDAASSLTSTVTTL
jgi:uncharacterized delta-60 repeat protein